MHSLRHSLCTLSLLALGTSAFGQQTFVNFTTTFFSLPSTTYMVVGYDNEDDLKNKTNGTNPTVTFVLGNAEINELDVYNQSIVEIYQGSFGLTRTFDQSTLNLYGGIRRSGLQAYDSSKVCLNGGEVQGDVSARNSSTITVDGSQLTMNLFARDNSQVTVKNGTVSGDLYAITTNTVTLEGGQITGNLFAQGTGTVTVSGGQINGDLFAQGTSTLNLTGSQIFTVTQRTERYAFDSINRVNAKVRDYEIEGTLADGTSFSKTITAAADTFTLTGNMVGLRGTATDAAADLYQTTNGIVNSVANRVVVGRNQAGSINTSPFANVVSGADVGDVFVYNRSNVFVSGGKINGDIAVLDTSRVTLNGFLPVGSGSEYGAFDPNTRKNYVVRNYSVTGTLLDGTSFNKTITAAANTFSVNPGNVALSGIYTDVAEDRYELTNIMLSGVYSNVFIGRGQFGGFASPTVTFVSGSDVVDVQTVMSSVLNVEGGTVRGNVEARDQSTVNITGGIFNGEFNVRGYSTLNLTGSGFTVTPQGVTGNYDPQSLRNYITQNYLVQGVLSDGTPFNAPVTATDRQFTNTGTSVSLFGTGDDIAPEISVLTGGSVTLNEIYNTVFIGSQNASPRVTLGPNADTGNVFVSNQSELTYSGGIIRGFVNADNKSSVTVAGKLIGQGLLADKESRVIVSNSVVGERLTAVGESDVTVSNSTVNENVVIQNNSKVTLNTTNIKGGIVILGTGSNLVRMTDTNMATLSVGDARQVTLERGSITNSLIATGTSNVQATDVNVGSLFVPKQFNGAITRNVVSFLRGSLGSGAEVNSGGRVTFTETRIGGLVEAYEEAEVTLNNSTTPSGLVAYNKSKVNINTSNVNGASALNEGEVNITSSTVGGGGVSTSGNGKVLLFASSAASAASFGQVDKGQIDISESEVGFVSANGDSTFVVQRNSVINFQVSANNTSEVTIYESEVKGDLIASNESVINASFSTLRGNEVVRNNGTINLGSGIVRQNPGSRPGVLEGNLLVEDNGTINFLGGRNVSYTLTNPNATLNQISYSQFTLSGVLGDGTNLGGKLLYLENLSNAGFSVNGGPRLTAITAVPGPAALPLMAVGFSGLGLLLRRRK